MSYFKFVFFILILSVYTTHVKADTTSSPSMVFNTASTSFFATPFPANARLLEHEAPSWKGLPNPGNIGYVEAAAHLAMRDNRFFSPSSTIYIPFNGPLPKKLYRTEPFQAWTHSNIALVNLDRQTPQYHPIMVQATAAADSIRPAHLLQILPIPGISLAPGRYAVIIRSDVDGDGNEDMQSSKWLDALLTDKITHHDPIWARWHESFSPLRSALKRWGPLFPHVFKGEHIVAATVFTVGDPTMTLRSLAQEVFMQPATQLTQKATIRPLKTVENHYVYAKGSLSMPTLQKGEPPFLLSHGQFWDNGHPLKTTPYKHEVPFSIAMPKGIMPKEGWPLYLYVHGTGGDSFEIFQLGHRGTKKQPHMGMGLAAWATAEHFAVATMASSFSPERIQWRALDGYGAYTFTNPEAMRNNFIVNILEHVRFVHTLTNMTWEKTDFPDVDISASPDKKIRFDMNKLIIGGQSLGSYLSGILASVLPVAEGVILSGAGGSWIEFAFGPKDPLDLEALLTQLSLPAGEKLDRFHPFIAVFQDAVGAADNTLYTRTMLSPSIQETRQQTLKTKIPHVLVIEGESDIQVPVNLQRALVLSLGIDMAGPDAFAPQERLIAPVLSLRQRQVLSLPVKNNLQVDYHTKRTAAVVRFNTSNPGMDGHRVWRERREGRAHIRQFLHDVFHNHAPQLFFQRPWTTSEIKLLNSPNPLNSQIWMQSTTPQKQTTAP